MAILFCLLNIILSGLIIVFFYPAGWGRLIYGPFAFLGIIIFTINFAVKLRKKRVDIEDGLHLSTWIAASLIMLLPLILVCVNIPDAADGGSYFFVQRFMPNQLHNFSNPLSIIFLFLAVIYFISLLSFLKRQVFKNNKNITKFQTALIFFSGFSLILASFA